jgi:hypothetical protein
MDIVGIGVIQEAHLPEGINSMLSIPGMGKTKWRYIRETIEWIPIFKSLSAEEDPENYALILSGVDYEPWVSNPLPNDGESIPNWVTPKGFPRDQKL